MEIPKISFTFNISYTKVKTDYLDGFVDHRKSLSVGIFDRLNQLTLRLDQLELSLNPSPLTSSTICFFY